MANDFMKKEFWTNYIYLLEKDKEKASVCSVETCIYLPMEPGHRGTISGGQTLTRMRTNGFVYFFAVRKKLGK